jgi:ABC-type transport system substrate-binding protein
MSSGNLITRRHATISLAVGLSTLAAGGPARADKQSNTLVFGQSVPVTHIGPDYGAFLRYPAGYEVGYVVFDRLVTFDAELNIRPQLAERWEISEDQKSATFHLRPNVKFQDGTVVNAEAVKLSIERMLDPARNTTNGPIWSPITGADVIDPLTVRVRTNEPYALLLNTLAHGSGAIVSPTAIATNGDKSMGTQPVGAGPYMLESFNPGQEAVLKAFPDYWGGKPKLDKIIFRYIPEASTRIAALKTGSVDVIDDIPSHLISGIKQDNNLDVIAQPGLRPMGLALLNTREPFNDPRVRRALNYAVPVKTIAEKLYFGFAHPSDSPLAFNAYGHKTVGSYDYDPKRASALLGEAGFKKNAAGILERDGKAFEIRFVTSDGMFPADLRLAEVAAKSFQDLGIRVEVKKVERASYWDYMRAPLAELAWDVAVFGFNPSNGAGSYHLEALYKSNADDAKRPASWNITRYKNANVDRLIEEAKVAVDSDKHKRLLGEAQDIIWNDAPYVFLQVNDIISAKRKDVKGVEVWPIIFTITRNAHY